MDIPKEIESIRKELDGHLDDINQGNAELSSLHEYVGELDLKMEKLLERVDALQALLLSQERKRSVKLTLKEQDVFQCLLGSGPLTSADVGRKTGLTADVVAQTLYCLKQKGIPILAQTVDEETFYDFERAFRNEQRKRNSVVSF